jgi:GH24 family phage-related lysozyme (muramidase)
VTPEDFVDDLVRWEGCYSHPYRDTEGYCTAGVGHLIKTVDAFLALPWRVDGALATSAQVRAGWAQIMAWPPSLRASAYERATPLRCSSAYWLDLAARRLEREFLPGLRAAFQGFSGLPDTAQRALVDMAWNLGTAGLRKYTALRSAVAARDWERAATESYRPGRREARNIWTRELLLQSGTAAVASNDVRGATGTS